MNNRTHDNPLSDRLPDDPRVTAYALGELQGEDAAAMERQLASSASLRSEVEAVRAAAATLRAGFAAEPAANLTLSQRESIMRQPTTSLRRAASAGAHSSGPLNSPGVFSLRARWIGSSLAAAAMLGLVATVAVIYFRSDRADRNFARTDSTPPAVNAPAIARAEGGLNDRAGGALRDSSARRSAGQAMPADAGAPGSPESNSGPGGAPMALADALAKQSDPAASALKEGQSDAADEALLIPRPTTSDGFVSGAAPGDRRDQPAPSAATPAPGPAPAARPADPQFAGTGGGGAGTDVPGGAAHSRDAASASGDQAKPKSETRERSTAVAESAPPPSPSPPPPSPAAMPAAESGERDKSASDASALDASAKPAEPTAAGNDAPPSSAPGTAGGNTLRQPGREKAGHDDSREADAETGAPVLATDEIARMNEGELKQALSEVAKAQQGRVDGRTEAQLKRQFSALMSRLTALRQAEAEEYSRINDNPFIRPVGQDALSTFAADIDTAAYANVRRFLNAGELPPVDAVRIEEMVNYFKYDYPQPSADDGDRPFKANVEVAAAPWNPEHRLVRVGVRGKDVRMDMRPVTSLVLLVDVSGSMNDSAKLPLVKQALKLLVQQLNGDDRLAIVTYAGNAGLALESCFVNAANREKIDAAIETMQPGGSTNGSGGINLAYDIARANFIQGGVNRVILCTDGDFNVGVSGDDALVQLIEDQRKSGVFLTVLGFGSGNFKDAKMEKLSNAGNGNFAYIDSLDEARKTLVEQAGGTLVAIAKDVKFQIEFNPAKVGAYRLIGYEDRLLEAEDFNNDLKDAGEIGSGHTMTALYEIVPVGAEAVALALNEPAGEVDELEYQKPAPPAPPAGAGGSGSVPLVSDDLLTVKIKYKKPDADQSEQTQRIAVKDDGRSFDQASADFRFASAVAEFGMLLRRSPYRGGATFDHVLFQAEGALGEDPQGYRAQFIDLVKKAKAIESAK